MSFIPARKMPHVVAKPGEFDAETGKIIHLNPDQQPAALAEGNSRFAWIAGTAGASLAAAVALGAFFALRSSSSPKPTRRRARATAAKKTATTRRSKPATRVKRAKAA